MHFLFGLIAYLLICYFVSKIFFYKDPNPERRMRKGLILTSVLAVAGIAIIIVLIVRDDNKRTSKNDCTFQQQLVQNDVNGTWHNDEVTLKFTTPNNYELTYFDFVGETVTFYGTFTSSVNIITFTLQTDNDSKSFYNGDKISFKVCDLASNEITFINLGKSQFGSTLKVKKID